jgi:hypothetical protein
MTRPDTDLAGSSWVQPAVPADSEHGLWSAQLRVFDASRALAQYAESTVRLAGRRSAGGCS